MSKDDSDKRSEDSVWPSAIVVLIVAILIIIGYAPLNINPNAYTNDKVNISLTRQYQQKLEELGIVSINANSTCLMLFCFDNSAVHYVYHGEKYSANMDFGVLANNPFAYIKVTSDGLVYRGDKANRESRQTERSDHRVHAVRAINEAIQVVESAIEEHKKWED